MEYNEDTVVRSIRMSKNLEDKIKKLAEESERTFTAQVKYMLKKYIEIQDQ